MHMFGLVTIRSRRTAVSTYVQHYVQYKEGKADQRRFLSSHLADYVL